jgi:hypothetical protein
MAATSHFIPLQDVTAQRKNTVLIILRSRVQTIPQKLAMAHLIAVTSLLNPLQDIAAQRKNTVLIILRFKSFRKKSIN